MQFTNTHSTAILTGNKNLLNGSGVALDDYDGNNALYRGLDSTGNFIAAPAFRERHRPLTVSNASLPPLT